MLRFLVGLASCVIIAGGALYAWNAYETFALKREEQARAAAQEQAMIVLEARLRVEQKVRDDALIIPGLRSSGCRQEIEDLIYVSTMKPVAAASDFSPELARRLRVCFQNHLGAPDLMERVKTAGLEKIFATN